MLALLTGPPGVGKTAVAHKLTFLHPERVRTISFGRLIYDSVLSRTGSNFSYSEFRTVASTVVSPEDIRAATESVADRSRAIDQAQWLIVDSHAVAREHFGWQANPDTPPTLGQFSYDQIIQLDASPETVLRRIEQVPAGRLATRRRDVLILAQLQMSISAYYSGVIGCPLNVVDAEGNVDEVVGLVEACLGLPASSAATPS
jgi:adenylate kinase